MRTLARLLVVALVIAAGSGLYWVDRLRQPRERAAVDADARHEPDYYFAEFELRQFDTPGAPRYVLTGPRLDHFADDGSAEVAKPELFYTNGDAAPWTAVARRGHVSPGGDRVDLQDDIVLEQRPATGDVLTVRTSRLSVFTEAGRAESERRVTATSLGQQLSGVGMTAWFEPGRVALHTDVSGHYDPKLAR